MLHALAQGRQVRHLRDHTGRISLPRTRSGVAADCFTRDGFVLADCTLGVFRKLKRRGLIASRGGQPYRITRAGLEPVRA